MLGLTVLGAPGIAGGLVPAGAGVVGIGAGVAGACATVVTTVGGLCVFLFSAAYPAAAAPIASTTLTMRIVAAERHAVEPVAPCAPAPHCRHQSWPAAIGAPHWAQLCPAGAGGGVEPASCSAGASAGWSAGLCALSGAGGESTSDVATCV